MLLDICKPLSDSRDQGQVHDVIGGDGRNDHTGEALADSSVKRPPTKGWCPDVVLL
jgi:hypothetical protein